MPVITSQDNITDVLKDTSKLCLIFSSGSCTFALDNKNIIEVIEYIVPKKIPFMNMAVSGLINLRGVIIPIVDLSIRLSGSPSNITNKSKIIILKIYNEEKETLTGLIVDSISNLLDLSEYKLLPAPDFGAGNIKMDYIEAVCEYNNDTLMVLNLLRALDKDELSYLGIDDSANADLLFELSKSIIGKNEEIITENKTGLAENDIEYILFALKNESYGIPLESVRDVANIENLTRIPGSAEFLAGVLNLREEAVPVIDMRLRCGISEESDSNKRVVLVIDVDGKKIGLIVDSVKDVININPQDIPFNKELLWVKNITSKTQLIFISAKVMSSLKQWSPP